MPSRSAGMSCFLRAPICAESRLRMSTICALRVVKVLRIRRFSLGSPRPASGRNGMNRAMISASIRSVFARVPRERAKALICAGGNWPAPNPPQQARPREPTPDHPQFGKSIPRIDFWRSLPSNPILTGPGISRIAATSRSWPSTEFTSRNLCSPGRQNPSNQSRDTSIPTTVAAVIMSLSLPYASRSRKPGRRQLFETVKRGGISPAQKRGQTTRCSALYPTPSPVLAGSGDGISIAGPRHMRCLILRFDGAILSQKWKEAAWDKCVMGGPRSRKTRLSRR